MGGAEENSYYGTSGSAGDFNSLLYHEDRINEAPDTLYN